MLKEIMVIATVPKTILIAPLPEGEETKNRQITNTKTIKLCVIS